MQFRKWIVFAVITLSLFLTAGRLLAGDGNSSGQIIKINLNLQRFIGKPTWLIVIRDVDHNQNIPYLYDITRNQDYFVALTYGHDYYVVASEMAMNPSDTKIKNFCGLESMGAIQRGISMDVMVSGKLTKNRNLVTCRVLKYADPNFNMTPQD